MLQAGLITGRRIDGRGTCLFPPGQPRPVTGTARIARDRAAAGLLSARQLGAQLGACAGTITRWHQLNLIDAAGTDHRGHPLYRPGQPRPTREQVAAAGRPAACRDEELLTGGQLATRLGVVRSTVYKWHRLGLIDAVTTDNRGRRLYRPGQQAPRPWQVTAARAAAAARTRKAAGQPVKASRMSDPRATITSSNRKQRRTPGTMPSHKSNALTSTKGAV